jgi:competence protein ComEC
MVDFASGSGNKGGRGVAQRDALVQQAASGLATPTAAAAVARLAALQSWLHAEGRRRDLWLPVAMAVGVAGYFALPAQPGGALVGAVAALGAAAGLIALRSLARGSIARWLVLLLAALALGITSAALRLERLETVMLERAGSWRLDATVQAVEPGRNGQRVTLRVHALDGRRLAAVPQRVRITVRTGGTELRPGDRIAVRARLEPPSAPLVPGGFDFARHAWFQGIGAIGYAFGAPALIEPAADRRATASIAALRSTIAARVTGVLTGDRGAVAAALLTGLRGAIDDATWAAMQASGLAHLLAISGLHMALVAGTLFGAARLLAGLVPPLVLRVPAQKVAAVVAFAGAVFYLALSGAPVPTQRAFVMVSIALLAMLVDRDPISLRLVAWAALVVLLLRPESVTGASFQLSFAAVIALVVAYERGSRLATLSLPDADPGLAQRLGRYMLGVLASTLIASLATAPLTAVHFQTVPTYGVLANLVAVPLTAFVVMPAGLLALAGMPLGLDRAPLWIMGEGIGVILASARFAAALPGAVVHLPQAPAAVLPLVAAGGLWLALWSQPWRWWGLAPVALALALLVLHRPPDLLVDPRLDLALARDAAGAARLREWRRDGWVSRAWLRASGVASALPFPAEGAGAAAGLACDPGGCTLSRAGRRVALARSAGALAADCRLADLVIARGGTESCPDGTPLIGARALAASGGLAVRLGADGVRVTTIAERRGAWPWVVPRR